jgi:ubiquitin-conjugating enzyme E2 variant
MRANRSREGSQPGPEDFRGRLLYGSAIALAIVLLCAQLARLLASLDLASAPWVLLGALLGALAADAVTGLVHWACDTWGDERTPWLGPTLIYAFREHHENPRKMLEHDWIVANREPGTAAAIALLLLSLPDVRAVIEGRPLLHAALCSLVAYGAAANQLHAWAHARDAPRLVRLAQRARLVLSPERHALHHRGANDVAYCISTGWLNPALDGIGFWRRLERWISTWTGAAARAQRLDAGRFGSG